MSRAFLAGLIVSMSAILAALIAASAIEANATGDVAVAKVSLMGATLACLVVLVGIFLTNTGAPTSRAPNCHNCGAKLFATLRSLDRRELLTCFTCGSEWVLPPAVAKVPLKAHASPEPAPVRVDGS
jgi:hypothetical protein